MHSRRWNSITVWQHPLLQRLLNLKFPNADFVVTGSAPLLLCNYRQDINDLDIVARGAAWAMAAEQGEVRSARYDGRRSIRLAGGSIEVLDGWFPSLFGNVQNIFDNAERIGEFNFMTVRDTIHWKQKLDRIKDKPDIQQHLLPA